MANEARNGPVEKAEEVLEKAADKMEPAEGEQAGSPPSASSPFSDGERPEEQPTQD